MRTRVSRVVWICVLAVSVLVWCAESGDAAYRSSSVNSGLGVVTVTGNLPSGTVDGDWLLAWLVSDVDSGVSTVPSGWTEIVNASQATPDGQNARLYVKVASSEPASWNWTLPNSRDWVMIVGAWSGRNTGGSLTTVSTINTSSNATPISVALTGLTAASGDDLAWFAQLDQQSNTDVWSFTASPASFTERQDLNSGWVMGTLHTRDNVSAGATGTLTGTATRSSGTANAGWSGVVVALPVSSGGAVTIRGMLLGVGP